MKVHLWSDSLLDSMRQQTDVPADEVVRGLFQRGQVGAANALMRQLVQGEQLAPEALAPPLRGYLEQSARLPSWADAALVARGQDVFARYGPGVIVSLFCASLPACYACEKSVQALHLTARLHTDAYRRVVETAQLVVDVMSPGGLAPGGLGVRSLQQVRLMHAAVRHLLLASGQWRPEWGQPINQEDLAFTLQTFSTVVLRSLERMGAQLSDAEKLGYHHCWRVAGYVLGLDERLLPALPAEGERLFDSISGRQVRESPEGRELMVALVDLVEHILPGNLLDGLAVSVMHHLLGEDWARLLAVPPSNWTRLMVGPLRVLNMVGERVTDSGRMPAALAELFGRQLVEGLLWFYRGPQRLPFRLPVSLCQSWCVRGWERA